MKPGYKWMARGVGVAALAGLAGALYQGYRLLSMAAGFKAKMLCSGLYVCHRDASTLLADDLPAADFRVLRLIKTRIDPATREVSAGLFGFAGRKARYQEGCGCVQVYRPADAAADAAAAGLAAGTLLPARPSTADPLDAAPPSAGDVDFARLQSALDWAFVEPPGAPRRTRAVVVLHRGRLLAERYAPGFTRDTPLIGWSMTKSVINALIGVLVAEGRLAVHAPAPIPAWRRAGDPRRHITIDHLLRMTSGLAFNEDYADPFADVHRMLFAAPDMAAYAAAKRLAAPPGRLWNYSSGSSNLLAAAIREVLPPGEYADFPHRALFGPLGMASAILETDAVGTYVASSSMYATARDWARFGQLYVDDGVWDGRRLLPAGWVAYSHTPTAAAADASYGAHFWLTPGEDYRGDGSIAFPPGAFHAVGHEGQLLSILPAHALVVVRLGLTRSPGAWNHAAFLQALLAALPPSGDAAAAPALAPALDA